MVAGAEAGAEAGADGVSVFSDEEAWDVLEDIPNDSAAALILLEHHWAVPLRDAIAARGRLPPQRRLHQPARPGRDRAGLRRGGSSSCTPPRPAVSPPEAHSSNHDDRSNDVRIPKSRPAHLQARRAPPLDLRSCDEGPRRWLTGGGPRRFAVGPRAAAAAERSSGDHGHGLGGRPGVERSHVVVVAADDGAGRFGHLVPDAGDVAQRLGHDQPCVLRELSEQLPLRIELAQRGHVGRVVERARLALARVPDGPRALAVGGGDGALEGVGDPKPAADRLDETDRLLDRGRRVVLAGRTSARGRTAPRSRSGPRSSGTATDRWRARGRA